MKNTIIKKVTACSCCGKDCTISFKAMEEPLGRFTHVGQCPTLGGQVFMAVTEDPSYSAEVHHPAPSFAIGSDVWPGLAKLAEECGELVQVITKIMAFVGREDDHPGGEDLRARLIEEMGDVMAALRYVREENDIEVQVMSRAAGKLRTFYEWHADEQRIRT